MDPLPNHLPHDVTPQEVAFQLPEYDPFAQHFPPEGITLDYMVEWLNFDAGRLKRDLAEGKIPGVDPQATRFDRAAVDTICDFYDSDFDDEFGEWSRLFRGMDPKEVDAIRRGLEQEDEFDFS